MATSCKTSKVALKLTVDHRCEHWAPSEETKQDKTISENTCQAEVGEGQMPAFKGLRGWRTGNVLRLLSPLEKAISPHDCLKITQCHTKSDEILKRIYLP